MNEQEPDLDRRIAVIQAQLDRLSAAVAQPAENRERVAMMETRLSELTQQCAEILDRWTLTDLRHTRAIGEMEARLNDWERLETRVEEDAHERLREMERKIEQEWHELRQMLEQPVQELQKHAASLRETSVATAGSALSGLERAETRLATIQTDLSDRMGRLSRDVQAVMAELRSARPRAGQPGTGGVQSWPLDQVMRLHNELRDTQDSDGPPPPEDRVPKTITLLPESAASLSQRIESVEQAVSTGKEIVRETFERAEHTRRSTWRIAAALLAIGLIAAIAFGMRLQRQMAAASATINTAQQEAEAARAAAATQIAASQKDAERQIAEAKETALRAQIVSEVLVASDLVRYGLAGSQTAPGARGQVLWSRSRGLVFSASRIPSAPSGSTYQLWLLTNSGPVSAALTRPDSEGRITLATDTIPTVPRPVLGVELTLEPGAGSPTPSGATVLTYRPPPPQ